MSLASGKAVSPTPHYYVILGRAAEIARSLGSQAGGPEHMFLAMLHDGGWPVTVISPLVDLAQAEAAVLSILSGPGYSPPPRSRFLVPNGYVLTRGGEVAFELGDDYLGVEHEFLSMIRARESVPARALAGLADLDALEAAVLAARNAPPSGPPAGAVFLPEGQDLDAPLQRALADALPDSTTFALGSEDERAWVCVLGAGDVSDPALTREVLNAALTSLNRPPAGG
jgi:Clp amino terminal domain, pathogenicity island component